MNPFDKFNAPKPKEQSSKRGVESMEWEVRPCPEGEDCWCRMIYVKDTDMMIIPGAVIREDMANYITKIHNRSLIK